jgi:hypothetical protein
MDAVDAKVAVDVTVWTLVEEGMDVAVWLAVAVAVEAKISVDVTVWM